MQSETAKTHLFLFGLTKLLFLLLTSSHAVAQQSVEENIRPAGQVCLAGQPCVGNTVDRAAIAMPATAAHVDLVAEPVAVVAEVVEVEEPVVAAFNVESTYQMSCFACHDTGAAGAPKLDDQDAWSERLAKGMDAVMANVVNGVNAMPPKGLCMTCSDDDLRTLVDYMINQ